jgi:hypothetical protein
MRGADLQDYVPVCVLEARLACLKAVERKFAPRLEETFGPRHQCIGDQRQGPDRRATIMSGGGFLIPRAALRFLALRKKNPGTLPFSSLVLAGRD